MAFCRCHVESGYAERCDSLGRDLFLIRLRHGRILEKPVCRKCMNRERVGFFSWVRARHGKASQGRQFAPQFGYLGGDQSLRRRFWLVLGPLRVSRRSELQFGVRHHAELDARLTGRVASTWGSTDLVQDGAEGLFPGKRWRALGVDAVHQ